jgi:hypothetical protein
MGSQSIYDIQEDKVKIEGKKWDDSEVQQLFYKRMYCMQKMVDYWTPFLIRGQQLFDAYDGRILTEEQRAVYQEVEGKYPIEPPIMKSPIRSLLGHIIKSRKSGEIIVETGNYDEPNDDVNEIETMNIVLKDLETKTKEQLKIRDAIHDALIACYPNVLLWEKRRPSYDNPLKYDVSKKPWNSCVFGPINIGEPDLSDIKELGYFDLRSQADLIMAFPKMKEQIDAHFESSHIDDKMIASIMNWDLKETAGDIEYLRDIVEAARGNMGGSIGLVPTYQALFPIIKKDEVFVNVGDETGEPHKVLPENWGDERKQKWAEANKDKWEGPFDKETIVLWRTVFTQSGLVLCNEKHWYQEGGKLPASFFVPCMLNGKPSGPTVDMKDESLRNCVAQIEYLDDMRKGNAKMLITRQGAFKNIEDIPEEACKAFGVGILDQNFPGSVKDAFAEISMTASNQWRDYGEFAKQGMIENTRLNETMQGQSAPRQAAVAKEQEIANAITVQALYIDNFNHQWEVSQNIKLSMVPRIYDETMIEVSGYMDEQQVTKKTMVNVPVYNMAGEKESVVNDVTSRCYKWKISAVDDSPTAKVRMMQEAMAVLNSASGPLMQADPSGQLFSNFMSALDNPILNKAGKAMAKDAKLKQESQSKAEQQKALQDGQLAMAKAQAELMKANKTGINMSFTGEQFAQYPGLLQLVTNLQQILGGQGQQQQPAQAPQPQQPPAPPQEQPAPEMAMA